MNDLVERLRCVTLTDLYGEEDSLVIEEAAKRIEELEARLYPESPDYAALIKELLRQDAKWRSLGKEPIQGKAAAALRALLGRIEELEDTIDVLNHHIEELTDLNIAQHGRLQSWRKGDE